MAFNEKEQEIIKYGLTNGKTKEQVSQALTNFRLGITTKQNEPIKTEPNLGQRIVEDIKQGQQKVQDIGASDNSTMTKFLQSTANITSLPIKVAGEILPEPVRKGIDWLGQQVGKVITGASDKLSETQLFKDIGELEAKGYDMPELKKLKDILTGVSAIGETAGNLAVLEGGTKGISNLGEQGVKVASNIKNTSSNAFNTIAEDTSGLYKKFTDKITENKIDPKTKTILQETPVEKLNKIIKQGETALKDPRALTPLEEAGNQFKQTAKLIKNDLNTIGSQKSELLNKVGTKTAPDIALKQIEKIKPLLQTKLTDAERELVNKYLSELQSLGKNPTLKSVDATIDKLQATLFEKSKGIAIPTTTRIKAFMNKSIGELNSELKSTVDTALKSDAYSTINSQYSSKVNLFSKINKALGEEGVKGGSLVKRFFSPSDAGTKQLFKEIKDNYGIDLAQDATLAKFVMETLGDTRAKSLLQLPPTTATGIAGKVLDIVEKKLTSPKKVFEKAKGISQ